MSEKPTNDELVKRVYESDQITFKRGSAEEALRESEEKFRLAFNASPDAVNINRMEDGLFVDINEGFTRLTGFTREDVIGNTSLEIDIWHDPADRQKLVEGLRQQGSYENLEAQFRRKDGSIGTGLMSARVLSIKGVPHIISITRDITERKQAEFERQRLMSAIKQSGEIVVITDINGTIQFVNPMFETITGYSQDEAIGQNPRILKSGHHDQAFYETLWETILAGKLWTGRIINKRKDGTLYTNECSISPVKKENGEIVNFVWIARDITKQLEIEKGLAQAQRMDSIGSLAGGIAHDFNNILFPILGMSEILMEDLSPESSEYEYTEEIFRAARRGRDLVKQILAFSRKSEHMKLPIRVQQVLKEVFKLVRSTIPSNIEISQYIQSDCGLVMADPTQVHQIAMNLITNAYHAVEQTGGKISVRLTEADLASDDLAGTHLKPDKYAMLSISDTGCGIDPMVKDKIFEPYFTTKEQGKGTGLGLAVVYGIVKEYHGDIKVYSEVGKGTTFNVYLPIMEKPTEAVTVSQAERYETGSERILLVDDEEPITRLEKQMLERLGYHVTSRINSVEALEAFKANPDAFDLVLTDMTMPNMTGDQLARELISIKPDIPIIICTGFSEKISQKRAKDFGIKGFLMKPIIKSEMAHVIRKVLDEAKKSDS